MRENLLGDVQPLVGGVNVGALRIEEFIRHHGIDVLNEAIDSRLRHSEELFRSALERIPPGQWKGEFTIDDDGSGSDTEFVVKVALERENGRLLVDFTGTSQQATGIINCCPFTGSGIRPPCR